MNVAAVVHHHEKGRPFKTERHNGVTIYRVPIHGRLAFAPVSPAFGSCLAKAVKAFQPDLLHIHMPNVSGFWPLFKPSLRKLPWVIHWHADVLGSAPDRRVERLYPFYRPFETALLKRASAVIATSPAYLESSEPLRPFRDKCRVVPLTLGSNRLPLQAGGEESSGPAPRILCVGRLTYYKGHEVLLRAAGLLAEQGLSFQIDIVGRGEEERHLKQLVEQAGLQDRVKFPGRLSSEELAGRLASCDLLCLPSIERTEAFGLVLLEAMAFAKPALVTDVPGSGMSWVVQDGHTGLVAKTGDAEDLAAKLAYAFDHEDIMHTMGANARRRFEEAFSVGPVVEKLEAVYREVCAR